MKRQNLIYLQFNWEFGIIWSQEITRRDIGHNKPPHFLNPTQEVYLPHHGNDTTGFFSNAV